MCVSWALFIYYFCTLHTLPGEEGLGASLPLPTGFFNVNLGVAFFSVYSLAPRVWGMSNSVLSRGLPFTELVYVMENG